MTPTTITNADGASSNSASRRPAQHAHDGLIAVREFTWTDTNERRPVAMVSENLARKVWQEPMRALREQIRDHLKGPRREAVGS